MEGEPTDPAEGDLRREGVGEKELEKEIEEKQNDVEIEPALLLKLFHNPSPHHHRRRIIESADNVPPFTINTPDNLGWTLLHYATFYGDVEMVTKLLDKGADPNASDNTGNTPLHWAIHHRKEELVDLLLERGSDPYKKNILSVSPLALAPEADKRRIAEIWKARRARHPIVPTNELDSQWLVVQLSRIAKITKAFLANQIIQILLQLLLVLLVEVFQEQFKRTFQVYVLVFFRLWNDNLITPLLSIFFPTALFGPILEVIKTVLPSLYKASFNIFYLFFLLLKPFWTIIYTLLLNPILQLLYILFVPACKFIFQNLLSKFSLPVNSLLGFLWKVFAPYLQQRELLKKLSYPFVASFAKIQVYLLPNWVLLRYEALISRVVGKDSRQKDLDIALVLVFSFLVLIEITVITFGYLLKVILLGCIWWKNNVVFGAAWIPAYFLAAIPPDDTISWWPNLSHHEAGAMIIMSLVLVTTMILIFIAVIWISYYISHLLWKRCIRKRKLK